MEWIARRVALVTVAGALMLALTAGTAFGQNITSLFSSSSHIRLMNVSE